MRLELLAQTAMEGIERKTVGEAITAALSNERHTMFKFAAAYLPQSGFSRILSAIKKLKLRGGIVSGAIGIDDGITSLEALQALRYVSDTSTVFHTVSGFIFHPKVYLIRGNQDGVAVIGSPNMTRDGLYRNVELAVAIHLDFRQAADEQFCNECESFLDQYLRVPQSNVLLIDEESLFQLVNAGAIKREAESREPGTSARPGQATTSPLLHMLFPPIAVPVAPPPPEVVAPQPKIEATIEGAPANLSQVFVMQLSEFDCSHRSGVSGTAEVLVPHDAQNFFPEIRDNGRTYPDAYFKIVALPFLSVVPGEFGLNRAS